MGARNQATPQAKDVSQAELQARLEYVKGIGDFPITKLYSIGEFDVTDKCPHYISEEPNMEF